MMMNHDEYEGGDNVDDPNTLFDQAKMDLDAAKADLDAHQTELEMAQERYNDANSRYKDAMQRFLEADLTRNCRWNQMYHKLRQWKEDNNGDTLVPTSKDSSADVKKLAKWVQNQRVFYKYFMNGDTKHIKQHRVDALNQIGFIWNVFDHQWNMNLDELREYYVQHKTFDVPKRENSKLANFVLTMRNAMKAKNDGIVQKEMTLTAERIAKLDAIGFVWDLQRTVRKSKNPAINIRSDYDQLYQLLVDFKSEYGHLKVSKMLAEWTKGGSEPSNKNYRRLSTFVASIKKEHDMYREGKPSILTEERVQQLTELGVKWKKPLNEPRKNTRGKEDDPNRETRKRRKTGGKKKSEENDDAVDDDAQEGETVQVPELPKGAYSV